MTAERPSFENINMRYAWDLSRRSTCKRLHVGCVILSLDYAEVFSIGYNGNARGLPNTCDSDEPGKCGCVLPGTLVDPTGITRAYRRRYEGEVVHVVTTAGDFTITPNHPVLAQVRGWVPAKLLQKGDYLLGTLGHENMTPGSPYNHNGVSIEKVFQALAIAGSAVRRPGTGHDFHGDGVADQEVDVVSIDGSLATMNKAPSGEDLREPALTGPDVVPAPLCGSGFADEFVRTVDDKAGFNETMTYNDYADAIAPSEGYSRFSSRVALNELSNGKLNHGGPLMSAEDLGSVAKHASLSQAVLDGAVGAIEAFRQLKHGLPGRVSANKVIDVQRKRWSGHVYNLETRQNWYSILPGGTIVHNCLHAEDNAVIKCHAPRDAPKVVLVTDLPCVMCAKRLVNLGGVRTVFYDREYRVTEGIRVLEQAGIAVYTLHVQKGIEDGRYG